jgi:eukaryotic-like serine/threonine-protein kinase
MKALTPEQLRKIEAIFEGALEQEASARNAFLDRACGADEALRGAVDSLIQSYKQAGDFLETPLVEEIFDPGDPQPFPEAIAQYRLLREIGRGGMGEVFLALDTRLERQVALKILPPQFTKNPQQVKRFEREARAASALNHPNIITIHDIVQEGDTHIIATEFIEGQTLRERLAGGRLSSREALEVALQIARALDAAHAAGIIHRDIKPENIMVRHDGLVKVLDFGLAKPVESDGRSNGSALRTSGSLKTNPETFMGTVGYMSPEQVLRKPVDHRTDIFSTGIVMYEMLCGERPFKGRNIAEVLDAVLYVEVAPLQIDNPQLAEIVHRALQKESDSRYQSAHDLCADLKALARQWHRDKASPAAAEPGASAWKRRALWATGVTVLLGLFAYLAVRMNRPPLPRRQAAVIATANPLTQSQALEYFPSFSPDGEAVVFESLSDNTSDIYLQRIGERSAINLTEDYPYHASQPAFAPHGERIAFSAKGIWTMSSEGKDFIKLTDEGFHPSWSPDGKEIVYALDRTIDADRTNLPSPLWIVNVETHARHMLTEGDAAQPSWSPNGQRIAYWSNQHGGQRDIWTMAADGSHAVAVTDDEFEDWGPIWSPDGKYLYFISSRGGSMNVWRIAIDERSGRVSGQPEPVTTPAVSCRHIAFSRDGSRIAYVQVSKRCNVNRLAFDPLSGKVQGEPMVITQGSGFATEPEVSSDNQWLIYNSKGDKQEDLFVLDLAAKAEGKKEMPPLQLTNDPFKDRSPQCSPDARKIAFFSDRGGDYQLWQINRDGSDLKQLTFAKDASAFCPVWSPDGLQMALCLSAANLTNTYTINTSKSWAEQTPQMLPQSDARLRQFLPSSWSADGLKLAGWQLWTERGRAGVYVYSFNSKSYARWTEFGICPAWLSDSRRLLFYQGDKIYLLDGAGKTPKLIHAINSLAWTDLAGISLSKDDRQLYYSQVTTEADIWIADIR